MFRRYQNPEDLIAQVEYGLPPERVRKKMSTMKLAEVLHDHAPNSIPHRIVEHELSMRLAKATTVATYTAAAIGLVTGIIGTSLQHYLSSSKPPQQIDLLQGNQNHDQQGLVNVPKPSASAIVVQPRKEVNQSKQAQHAASQNAQPHR